MSSKGAPSSPSYVPAAPYVANPTYTAPQSYQQASYTSPGAFVNPSNPQTTIPNVETGMQVAQGGAAIESTLPQWLQLGNENPLNPAGTQAAATQYYNQNEAPQINQTASNLANSGALYGSAGGGQLGAMQSQAQYNSYNAGLDYAQQYFNDQIAGRNSYFAGGIGLEANQNAANVARGEVVQNDNQQIAQSNNNYNLSSASMANNFNQSNANASNAYSLASTGAQNAYGINSAQSQNAYNTSQSAQLNGFRQQNYQTASGNYQAGLNFAGGLL